MEHGRSGTIVRHTPVCICGANGVRSDKRDAYFCPVSGEWLEKACSDAYSCSFCQGRPVDAQGEPEFSKKEE